MDSTPGSVRRPRADQPNRRVSSAMTASAGARHVTRNDTTEPVTSLRRGREIDMKYYGVFVLDGSQRGAVRLVSEATLREFQGCRRAKHVPVQAHRRWKLHGLGESADGQLSRDQVSARRLASDPARDEGDTGKLGDAELRFRFHALLDLLDIVGRWLAAHAEPAPCARLIGLEACRVDVHANRRRLRR